MRRLIFVLVLVLVVSLIFGSPKAFTCDRVHVEGEAYQMVYKEHGNSETGGQVWEESGGRYSVWGRKVAEGEANACGLVSGKSQQEYEVAKSCSFSKVYSDAQQIKGYYSELEINGYTGQANWATVGQGENFAGGGNFTEAGYAGKICGNNEEILGGAKAAGKTSTEISSNANSFYSSALTVGLSRSCLAQKGDPWVYGKGGVETARFIQKNGTEASTYSSASFSYQASGLHFSKGSGIAAANNNITFTTNGVQAQSSSRAKAKTHSH